MVRDDGSTTAPATGGGGPTADIALTIADVEKIGRDAAALGTHSDAARTALSDARGGGSAFGDYAPAQQLFTQHQAVVEVFEQTLTSMTTDLDDFGNAIVQAAHNHAQTDDDVLAALTYVGSGVSDTHLRSAYDQARATAGDKLQDVVTAAADAADLDTPAPTGEGGDTFTSDEPQ